MSNESLTAVKISYTCLRIIKFVRTFNDISKIIFAISDFRYLEPETSRTCTSISQLFRTHHKFPSSIEGRVLRKCIFTSRVIYDRNRFYELPTGKLHCACEWNKLKDESLAQTPQYPRQTFVDCLKLHVRVRGRNIRFY